MKTHEFARQLNFLAKILKNAPDIELEDFELGKNLRMPSLAATISTDDIPQALNMLVGLNNVPKQSWITLIEEFGFDIEIRPRDANRDIYGKLLKFLSDHPNERQRLLSKRGKQPINASSELADALNLLMK